MLLNKMRVSGVRFNVGSGRSRKSGRGGPRLAPTNVGILDKQAGQAVPSSPRCYYGQILEEAVTTGTFSLRDGLAIIRQHAVQRDAQRLYAASAAMAGNTK